MVDCPERFVVIGYHKTWMVCVKVAGGEWSTIQGEPSGPKIWSCEGDAQEYVRLLTGDYCPTIPV